ncbi:MAG: DinB family protein [Terriglobales bacterium]
MLEQIPPRLAKISTEASTHVSAPDGWSARQELGHLLDSAIMNHQRLLRVLAEENPTLPGYDGVFCVAAHDYHARDWQELIAAWQTLNAHFLWAIERIGGDQWQRSCVSEGKSVTLEFLVSDYVHHSVHHLQHMGANVSDLETQLRATA